MYGASLVMRLVPLIVFAAIVSIAVMLPLRRFRGGRGQRTATLAVWSLMAAGYLGTILVDRTGAAALPIAIVIADSWSDDEAAEIIAAAEYWNELAQEAAGRPAFILRRGEAGYRPDRSHLGPIVGRRPCDSLNVIAPEDADPAEAGGDRDDMGEFIFCGWHWPGGDIVIWRRQVWSGGWLDRNDLRLVARHELGHMLGLSHDGEFASSTMAPFIRQCSDESVVRMNDLFQLERLLYGD